MREYGLDANAEPRRGRCSAANAGVLTGTLACLLLWRSVAATPA